jgi:hypothetical protein
LSCNTWNASIGQEQRSLTSGAVNLFPKGRGPLPLYDAFISYGHAKDKPIAGALQSVVQKLGKPWYRRRALRVFRDDTSLSATPQLWPSIENALSESRYLILFASPEAAASPWVGKEVEYWLEHRNPSTLLIGLTAGELSWDDSASDFAWSAKTPLPKALQGRFASEPKWVDLRAYRDGADPRNTQFIELGADFAAAIHGMPKEDLLSQEVRQQRRALTLAWGAAASLLVLLGAAVLLYLTAEARRQAATHNESVGLAALSSKALGQGRPVDAIQLATAAWPREGDSSRPQLRLTLESLASALPTLRERLRLKGHEAAVNSAAFSPDGTRVVTASWDHTARVWDAATGAAIAVLEGHESDVRSAAFSPDGTRVVTASGDGTARVWESHRRRDRRAQRA